jgi:hypothetical protein
MAKRRRSPEPICRECSHGERGWYLIEDPATLNPPAKRTEQYPTNDWTWRECRYCHSIYVFRGWGPGMEMHRIGYRDDATSAWHDVKGLFDR